VRSARLPSWICCAACEPAQPYTDARSNNPQIKAVCVIDLLLSTLLTLGENHSSKRFSFDSR
jgi:hypothetical protein